MAVSKSQRRPASAKKPAIAGDKTSLAPASGASGATFKRKVKSLNLALQGGGSHGAFTWGVLDRILEDPYIEIEALSGTSAGALNAVVLAHGFMKDGKNGARAALRDFWRAVSEAAKISPIQRSMWDILVGNWNLDQSPGYLWMDMLNRFASPYELNPFDINPLRDLLNDHVDFELVRSCNKLKVLISATNVETGRVRIFDRTKLTSEMVMASACLPFMFQAVEIDGVPYWDGGYAGNPALFPFFNNCSSPDIVVVQINPIIRKGAPKTARDILNRVNEITFNNSLLKEFRAIDFVSRLIDDGLLNEDDYKRIYVHVISADEALLPLGASSKVNAEWAFLEHLFEIGRDTAEQWVAGCYDHLGKKSTVDTREMFHGEDGS